MTVTPSDFVFVANHPAVDFVNTELIEATRRVELVRTDADLFRWARAAGLIAPARARMTSERLHPAVRPLRAAIRALLAAQLAGSSPPASALAVLNAALARSSPRAPLVYRDGRFARPMPAVESTRELLARVAQAAAELLTGAELTGLRACANSGCILMFVDRSKAGRRRWCSMEVCGNRAKVAAHQQRARQRRGKRAPAAASAHAKLKA